MENAAEARDKILIREVPESGFLGRLRGTALIVVLVGAGGSVGLMLHAGRRQDSRVLLLLFGIWVLSPFVGAAWAYAVSKRWSVVTQAALYFVMLVLTLGSLAIYGGVAFEQLRAKVGFIFLVVPLVSWLLIAVGVPLAKLISVRLSHGGDSV